MRRTARRGGVLPRVRGQHQRDRSGVAKELGGVPRLHERAGDELRVAGEAEDFERIWEGDSNRLITLDVPEAERQNPLWFLPEDDRPTR